MKVHERRGHPHASDEEKKVTRKQKAESKSQESGQSPKKPKTEGDNEQANGKSNATDIAAEFEKFCKATSEHLSIKQMREILEANGRDSSVSDDAVVPRCQDILFYGPLGPCPVCGGTLEFSDDGYHCQGAYSEWSSCVYSTRDPPRREEPLNIPDSVGKTPVSDLIEKHRDPKSRLKREITGADKPFAGMMISLSGRLSRTHQYWKTKIEKNGGKVANSVIGGTCLVVSPTERDRGGSSKVAEAVERGIPVVREAWLADSIEKKEALALDAYDVASDIAVDGKGIALDKQDSSVVALETVTAELKVFGKRGVHKDTKLQDEGGTILEKDGLLYNCALTVCDQGRDMNDFCIMQLIMARENHLHLYYKKGKIGDSLRADDKLEEWENLNDAIKEFAKLFEELTGNEFEPWEREKKIQKKHLKFFPIDIDDGVEVRHGGLGLRQLGVAAAHSKLDPKVASFMKVLCSQEIYRYALMEMGYDSPEVPVGMLTDFHLKRCEETLLHFADKLKSSKETGNQEEAIWADFSQRWFTLMPTTRPLSFKDFGELADHAASAYEAIRDINTASRLIGDMSGSTLDDPLFDRYVKLGCSVSPLEKETDDYKMIVKYLEKTYDPVTVGDVSYGVSVENIFAVEVSACPSLDDIKKLPNKVLLWCGTRSSNLLRHLQMGFLPATCALPAPGYMFGRAIVCSDAAAEAARYGYTAVDRPEGFLVLAVASLGEEIQEFSSPPEDTISLEEKKIGVKGLGKKKTDESEHFVWKDDIKVPCGKLIPSEYKDSPLEYNEYAVYDPEQVSIRFLVAVKFEEQDVEYDTVEPEV
ncbi:PREDICTED: poly [ADP-ribose] polymerase 3 [Nicotiana attenuata]|uniref:Poly [ADP-ribose] polymerase n=1 Tax=Nicotiana attenuata TaxID=49451 RepID=A0A1J6JEB1_NICAT|nr:PREDICTED: poly [ADP-ribose] polymerase 3 [Nicotiana attenuata]OIT08015.1 poly [adp-ribose] polymerase 3 [Nicotiana attenuata]